MQITIRAEDFSYSDDFINLGGRIVSGSSILSMDIQRRTSAELIGLLLALVAGIWGLKFQTPVGARLAIILFILFLAVGAVREIRHNYVVTLNIFQIGQFEIRGLTRIKAEEVHQILHDARGGQNSPPFIASAGDAS